MMLNSCYTEIFEFPPSSNLRWCVFHRASLANTTTGFNCFNPVEKETHKKGGFWKELRQMALPKNGGEI